MNVKMIHSVGDYVAGESYEIPDDEADRFVILGYAEGSLSREFTDEERQSLAATNQAVTV